MNLSLQSWIIVGLGIALAAALSLVGVQTVRLAGAKTELAEHKAQVQAERAAQHAQAAEDGRQNAKETQRRLDQHQENQRARDALYASAVADRDAARSVAAGLREQTAIFVSDAKKRAAGNPSAGIDRASADAALDLLAELFSRSDETSGELAEYADAARIAGQQCQASYDALTTGPPTTAAPATQ